MYLGITVSIEFKEEVHTSTKNITKEQAKQLGVTGLISVMAVNLVELFKKCSTSADLIRNLFNDLEVKNEQ